MRGHVPRNLKSLYGDYKLITSLTSLATTDILPPRNRSVFTAVPSFPFHASLSLFPRSSPGRPPFVSHIGGRITCPRKHTNPLATNARNISVESASSTFRKSISRSSRRCNRTAARTHARASLISGAISDAIGLSIVTKERAELLGNNESRHEEQTKVHATVPLR